MRTYIKAGSTLAIGAVAAIGLAACSSSADSSSSTSPTPTVTTSSASPTSTSSSTSTPVVGATCTSKSIQSALPDGSTVTAFKCGSTGDGQIAGVSYGPGTNVIFLKTTGIGGPWQVVDKNSICGTASAGLPQAVLAFCSK